MDAMLVVVTMSIALGVCFGYMFRRCIMGGGLPQSWLI